MIAAEGPSQSVRGLRVLRLREPLRLVLDCAGNLPVMVFGVSYKSGSETHQGRNSRAKNRKLFDSYGPGCAANFRRAHGARRPIPRGQRSYAISDRMMSWRDAVAATGLEGDAVGGVEQHLLELTRQVATPHQARRGGQGAFSEPGADHAGGVSRRIWLGRFGPVPEAMLRAG